MTVPLYQSRFCFPSIPIPALVVPVAGNVFFAIRIRINNPMSDFWIRKKNFGFSKKNIKHIIFANELENNHISEND